MSRVAAFLALVTWSARASAQIDGSSSADDAVREAASAAAMRTVERATLTGNPVSAMPLPGSVDPRAYRVGPGDVLQLHLWGRVTRTQAIEVGPEGTVLLPGSGSIRVDGLSLEEARAAILHRLAPQYRGVSMDLRLARPRSFRVYLTGQVKVAGSLVAYGTSRVADLLDPTNLRDDASLRRIEVIHRDGVRVKADVGRFLRTGEAELNPWLQDGDVVHLPVATEFVFVQGAVAAPGRFELGIRDSLRTLLRMAGDPLPSSSIDSVLWVRWSDQLHADSVWMGLDDVYSGRLNDPVHDGDRVYVYFVPEYRLQHEATVVGEVARPGVYPIAEGRTRLSDLVRAAGGFLTTADLAGIGVRRSNADTGEKDPELDRLLQLSRDELTVSEYEQLRTKLAGLREDYRVNWEALQKDPGALDLLMRNGDVVRVDRLLSSIRVDGEVRRPAILSYRRGMSIDEYVRDAGGYTDRAWRGKVRVTRAVTGQTLLARNVSSLDPGDFVWVPEKPDRTTWEQMGLVLTALAQIATIVIAIRSVN